MRFERLVLNVSTALAAGTPERCAEHLNKWVQVDGAFTATLALEGRIGDGAWVTVKAPLVNGDCVEVPQTFRELRINTTGAGTAPVVTYGFFNARTAE